VNVKTLTSGGPADRKKFTAILRHQEAGLLAVLITLAAIINIINPNFLSPSNVANLLQTVAVIGIIAIGQTFVLVTREIDLSVGSVLALSAVSAGYLFNLGLNPWVAALLGVAVGGACGLVTGMIVVFGKVSSFIVTLGMLSVARGLTQLITGGLPQQMPDELSIIGQGRIADLIPVSVIIFIALVIVGQIVLSGTVFGLRVTAIGDNPTAAKLGGMPVPRTRIAVFVIIGLLSGVAGIIYATRVGVAEAQAAQGYELTVIAAAVIGGASLSGGRGTVIGAFLGACLLGLLRNSFVLLALSPFWQQVSIGAVIILAALFDQVRQGNLGSPGSLIRSARRRLFTSR
jgi:ribose/xylose/arabinose/galactoside ABC-type transport system permease subunit